MTPVPVELSKYIIQENLEREFALWLYLKKNYNQGHFKKEDVGAIATALGVSKQTIWRWIAGAKKAGFIRGMDKAGRIYFNSTKAINKRFNIDSKSHFFLEGFDNMSERLFSAYILHLIRFRKSKRKLRYGNHAVRQSCQLSEVLDLGFNSSQLSVTYLCKTLKVSRTKVQSLKKRSHKLRLLEVKHNKLKLQAFDKGVLTVLAKEDPGLRRKIFKKGRNYYFNHADSFSGGLKFFNRASQ